MSLLTLHSSVIMAMPGPTLAWLCFMSVKDAADYTWLKREIRGVYGHGRNHRGGGEGSLDINLETHLQKMFLVPPKI